jgi:elongator complex protein 2
LTFFWREETQKLYVFSGSADKTIRCWCLSSSSKQQAKSLGVVGEHTSSISNLSIFAGSDKLVSAGADSSLKIWSLEPVEGSDHMIQVESKQEIKLRAIPLALAVYKLKHDGEIIAVGGTHTSIQIYASNNEGYFNLSATLSGHNGWIRALDFVTESDNDGADILLASASQDKFIRLWRVHEGTDLPSSKRLEDPSLGVLGRMVSTKAHKFECLGLTYSIMFEALLLGHEDWVYSCSWHTSDNKLRLLSSSADNSVAIWKADESSGIWVCTSRLGDVSAQKGSTTATGSAGGFWNGLWSPDGNSIVSLSRIGSWRLWKNTETDRWTPDVGCGGHVRSVTGIAWSRHGGYLLSTSSDQTTRLHAQWKQTNNSWHEFSRPQIHGYDMNCVDVISNEQFISGADEKPLRVFQQPSTVADMLEKFCGIHKDKEVLPDAANIPVLGLSNKAITTVEGDSVGANGEINGDAVDPSSVLHRSTLDIKQPPLEDHLSKHLLWPELQKLYGHGFEISAVSVSHDGSLIATACKASSIDHAVIRIYDTNNWRELPKPLTAHSLTITSMEWSPDDKYLLSVGRDRIWAISERDGHNFEVTTAKGHTRMILDCSWAPLSAGRLFATAGRDKSVKLWQQENSKFENKATITMDHPVTAVSFSPKTLHNAVLLAIGLETGEVFLHLLSDEETSRKSSIPLETNLCPNKAITSLAWRPTDETSEETFELAVASEDGSLRILQLSPYPQN